MELTRGRIINVHVSSAHIALTPGSCSPRHPRRTCCRVSASDGYASDGYASEGYASEGYASDGYASTGASSASGRRIRKVVPSPSTVEKSIWPSSSSMLFRAIASPRPVPLVFVEKFG